MPLWGDKIKFKDNSIFDGYSHNEPLQGYIHHTFTLKTRPKPWPEQTNSSSKDSSDSSDDEFVFDDPDEHQGTREDRVKRIMDIFREIDGKAVVYYQNAYNSFLKKVYDVGFAHSYGDNNGKEFITVVTRDESDEKKLGNILQDYGADFSKTTCYALDKVTQSYCLGK